MRFLFGFLAVWLGIIIGSLLMWSVMIDKLNKARRDHEAAKRLLIQEWERPIPKCRQGEYRWITETSLVINAPQ